MPNEPLPVATKPSDYKHIRAWGKMLLSYDYYIENQQAEAFEDKAPIDATFKSGDKWHTARECTPETQRDLEEYFK